MQRALTNPSFGPWKNEEGYLRNGMLNGVNPYVLTCVGAKANRSGDMVREEPRIVESPIFGQRDRFGRRLPVETTGSLPRADSQGVSSSLWFSAGKESEWKGLPNGAYQDPLRSQRSGH